MDSARIIPSASGTESENIHPTAFIHPEAKIGKDVKIGAFSLIGAHVEIGDGTEILNHVSIEGPTKIGRGNRIHPQAVIGQDPQDKKYTGEGDSKIEIGDNNIIREFVSIQRGTPNGKGLTLIGNDNWIMAYSHIAHDCIVGNACILANNSTLGGVVTIHDKVYLGGLTAIHQFCTIGEMVMTGGHTMIAQDVPPYMIASGNRVKLYGINKIGLARNGVPPEEIKALQKAYKLFFRSKLTQKEGLEKVRAELGGSPAVAKFLDFISASTRGICR